MTERKPLSISVEMNTDKLQLKLRAIAKHTEALVDELDRIDNAWQCDCGSIEYVDKTLTNGRTDEVFYSTRTCNNCGESYAINDDELPTRLEGSD